MKIKDKFTILFILGSDILLVLTSIMFIVDGTFNSQYDWITWGYVILGSIVIYCMPIIVYFTYLTKYPIVNGSKLSKKIIGTMFLSPIILIFWDIWLRKEFKNNLAEDVNV
ncbi:hypothetical protein SCHIN_v1c04700 [Spiroplasma chinense]|uniref:Uncharacterized protein n=1 Tax=Spiroplasma chinense TaxID=216932 RepID=A0A5B9Y5V5_9MOLU|nr:hypothetical protein [Spiroplasma chinense]QEH61667.1 hypothetical protein SCHIN_v1c04700 [Spiroplasma chinense]